MNFKLILVLLFCSSCICGYEIAAHKCRLVGTNGLVGQKQPDAIITTNVTSIGMAGSGVNGAIWPSLQSTNYAIYIDELRKAGVPAQTLTAIVLGDVLRDLQRGGQSNVVPTGPGAAFRRAILRQQKAEKIIQGLGLDTLDKPGDYFFSSDKLKMVRKSLSMSLYATNLLDKSAKFHQRLAFLDPLTEDQTVYFKSEFEGFGRILTSVLGGFRPEKDEFYRMILAMDTDSAEELTSKLPTILSSERYAEYVGMQTPDNRSLAGFSRDVQNPELVMPRLEEIVHRRGSLSYQEYRNQLLAVLGRDQFELFSARCPGLVTNTTN